MGAGGTIVIGRTRLMSRCVLLVAFVVHAAATVAVSGDSTFPSALGTQHLIFPIYTIVYLWVSSLQTLPN